MQPSRVAYRVSPKLGLGGSLVLAKNPHQKSPHSSGLEIDIDIG